MITRQSDQALIRSVPILAELPAHLIDLMLVHAVVQTVPAGTRLFEPGDRPTHLHVVLSGRLGLVAVGEGRGEAVVEFFTAGDAVIAPAVILDLPYLLAGRVVEESRILMLPADDVRHLLEAYQALSHAMMRALARHWRLLIRQIKDLKLRSANERLASYLLILSGQRQGWLQLQEDRRLLAQRLAMTPESLSRAFAALRAHGVVTDGRKVLITEVETLRRYCGFDDLV